MDFYARYEYLILHAKCSDQWVAMYRKINDDGKRNDWEQLSFQNNKNMLLGQILSHGLMDCAEQNVDEIMMDNPDHDEHMLMYDLFDANRHARWGSRWIVRIYNGKESNDARRDFVMERPMLKDNDFIRMWNRRYVLGTNTQKEREL